jgi:bacterioferritin
MEQTSVSDYNRYAKECGEKADSATKRIFEELVIDEERHLDQFEVQQDHIKKYGEQFLALQSFERGKTISGPGEGGG